MAVRREQVGAGVARADQEEGSLTVLPHGENLGVGQEAPVKRSPF